MIKGRLNRIENDFLRMSLLAREIAYQEYCTIPLKKGKRHKPKKKYWPHPWDKEDDDKQFETMKNAMEALKNKHGSGN